MIVSQILPFSRTTWMARAIPMAIAPPQTLLAPDGRRLSKRDRDLNLDQLAARWSPLPACSDTKARKRRSE